MKQKILTNLLILFYVASYSQNDTISIQKLDFKIIFPAKSEYKVQSSESALGKINTHFYDATKENNFYRVAMNEFIEIKRKFKKEEVDRFVKGFKKGFLNSYLKQNAGCYFITEDTFQYKEKHEGFLFTGKIRNEIDFKINLIIKDNVLYALLIVGSIDTEDAKMFINSFDFIH